jgi:EpsD family peptidyl-prolyl cis-trans isomerase
MRLKLAIVLAIAVVAGGCDKKAEGQVVAVVNGEEISAAELNTELQKVNLPAGADTKQARARILQGIIDRRVLSQEARENGLDKSPEFLNQQRRMTEDLLIRMLVSRQADTSQLPNEKQITEFTSKNRQMFADREQWSLEQLRFAMPSNAEQLKKLNAAPSLDAVAKILAEAGISGARAKTKLDTAVVPADLYGRIATMPAGRPFIVPIGNMGVASVVVAREPAPLTGEAARPVAVAAMRQQQTKELLEKRLKDLRQSAKIEYQSGFAPPAAK